MNLDIEYLQQNFLEKPTYIRQNGCSTDIVVCLIQSSEVVVGNYYLATNYQNEAHNLLSLFAELTPLVSNLTIMPRSDNNVTFSNGSKIFFEHKHSMHYVNMYLDINNQTNITVREKFKNKLLPFISESRSREKQHYQNICEIDLIYNFFKS